MKVLMVCLGNICRSPLAEGILKHKIAKKGLSWQVDSCGTSGWHESEFPDIRSIEIARKYGIDITDQRSRPLLQTDLENFDLIFAMDSSNFLNIKRLAKNKNQENKIKLIMNEVEPEFNISVPDPYYDDNGFEEVFEMLNNACEAIIENYG